MAVEGVAVVGFDLAVELERALAFAPPGDDYLVVRHPIQPDTGEIYTLRVQSVTVTSNVNVPVDAVNGTPVGQVTLDVVVDSDLTLVVQGLQSSFIPQRNLLFRSVIPLSWRGTATDLQPGVTVADFPAGFTNQRDRLTPRIVWAECPIGAPLLEGLPRGIRPPNRVPDRLPVATWPDEIVMAPAVPATLLTHVGIPGATFAPVARLIGIMASGVVQQALDLPRVLTESVARGGGSPRDARLSGPACLCHGGPVARGGGGERSHGAHAPRLASARARVAAGRQLVEPGSCVPVGGSHPGWHRAGVRR
jgi:hypothetical protein